MKNVVTSRLQLSNNLYGLSMMFKKEKIIPYLFFITLYDTQPA